jgi:hypothetical protein
VSSDGRDMFMNSVMFHARLPESTLSSTTPCSLAKRALSYLASSLSRAKSCSHSSVITASSVTASERALNQTMGGIQHHNKTSKPR